MNASLPPSDQQLLAGLRSQDNRAFAKVYSLYYPAVERLVLRNSGTRAHAQDIFQETVLVLLKNTAAPDFTLSSSLKTYLLAVSGNLWLKRLRQNRRVVRAEPMELEQHLPGAEPAAFDWEAENQQHTQVQGLLARISAKCQALIKTLFFGRKTVQAFTEEQGYTSVHNARNQKYKCLEQARRNARKGAA